MPVVAVTDFTFPSLEIEERIVHAAGAELRAGNDRQIAALKLLVADADAVITQFAPIHAEVISEMRRAKVIVRYGIGYDTVDVKAARERGIPVCNIPDYCIDEVADHTLAFILGVTRQVVPNTLYIRDGKWGLATPLDQLRTLRDQTVGIVGFGRIGREVAARLAPFKSRRLVFDAFVPADTIRSAGCEAGYARRIIDPIRHRDIALPFDSADQEIVEHRCTCSNEARCGSGESCQG